MIVWAVLGALSMLTLVFSIWMIVAIAAIRIASAIDFVLLRRRMPAGRPNDVLAVIAFAVAAGFAVFAAMFVFQPFKIPASSGYPALQIGDHVYVEKLSKLWRSSQRGDLIVFDQPCEPDRQYVKRVIATAGDTVEVRCNVVYVNGAAIASELIDAACTYVDFDERGQEGFSRQCSRYHETLDGHGYDVFHDAERPQRDEARAKTGSSDGDSKDFPFDTTPRTCTNRIGDYDRAYDITQQPGTIVVTEQAPATPCEPHMHFVVPAASLFVMGDNRPNSNDSRYWGTVPVDAVRGRIVGIWFPLGRFGAVH